MNNNFGALRLIFASLVILSHSPELIDGNATREILHQLFGTMTFGGLAVDGFFLISGYLITASYQNSRSLLQYFAKRIYRIYPGFIIASLVSIFIFAPLSGGVGLITNLALIDLIKIPIKILFLQTPWVDGAFSTNEVKVLNGSLWTIQYEFFCYICIPLLLLLVKKHKFLLVPTLASMIYLYCSITHMHFVINQTMHISLFFIARFIVAFSVGMSFYLYKDRIAWNKKISAFCGILMVACLLNMHLAELGSIFFGGYLMFNLALNYKNQLLNSIGSTNDISYGVYLYAFPFQNLMIQYNSQITPWQLTSYSILFAYLAGFVSWNLVEKPFIALKKQAMPSIHSR